MPLQKNNKSMPFWAMIVWILVALMCIGGYFLLQKKHPQPPAKPLKQAGKLPLKKAPPIPVGQVSKKTYPKPAGAVSYGKAAIIIDDWGYNRSHCQYLAQMPVPVAVAILPHLPYSKIIIQCAKDNGQEPMLHLPFEPHSAKEAFEKDYDMTTDMSDAEARAKVVKILNEMTGVVGVNNHTGSKGTEDEVLVTNVLTELKRRGLFFVDSMTSDRSVCGIVAQRLKMRIGRRDIFLDNRNERAYIERQFADAMQLVRQNGHAIIIGHDRALTLDVIIEQARKYSQEGYQFITVKDYIRQYEYSGN
ncbi:MAG: divergent polysaccharide deacetylase family protein [Candidatus Omnitrophica bacterium]|nr:divergent polysaccharide deacetylase family protein [Candidatus Omnitrophota bacterium]